MNIDETINETIKELIKERDFCQATEKKAHDRIVEINRQIGKLETQKKRIEKILGDSQKAIAE